MELNHIAAMVTVLRPVLKNSAKAHQILEQFWADKLALVWTVQDVYTAANERGVALTKEDAVQVLHGLRHDKQFGVKWEDLTSYIEESCLGRPLTKAEIKRFVEKNMLTTNPKLR